ncbi:MAG TPA: type II toxin-antitoxin system RelE/ParE family toxin [Solirubrobacterales bacterium]|nr:type II toxin-antitoxin system RelE/ParE family toxin [Solirubrobacterales bacterium]
MFDVLLEGGSRRLVWGADSSGRFRAREYFDDLKDPDRAKFEASFRMLAETGHIKSKERFVKEPGGIWCFKQHGMRIACLFDERDVVLIHGFGKKATKSKRSRRELETAAKLKDHYLEKK